ncbi:MAG: TRAP transporter small permease [Gemmobacter sp.]|jgi:TRAP-type C4-dicarboxylate transport system permease small subunit
MMRLLEALDVILMRVCAGVIVATSVALVLLVSFLVLDRIAIGTSFMGTHELALMAAMWLYMVGAIVAMRNREHIRVDYLAGKITHPRWAAGLSVLTALIVLGVALFFARLAQDLVVWALARPQRTPALGLSQLWAQAAVVVAAALAVVYALRDVAAALVALSRGGR